MRPFHQTKKPRRGRGSNRPFLSRGFFPLAVSCFRNLHHERVCTAGGVSASSVPHRSAQNLRNPFVNEQQVNDYRQPEPAGPRGTQHGEGGGVVPASFTTRPLGNHTTTPTTTLGTRPGTGDLHTLPSIAPPPPLTTTGRPEQIPNSSAGETTRPPKKRPKKAKSAPVIIFDWDDTLFPTWYVKNVIACLPHGYINTTQQNKQPTSEAAAQQVTQLQVEGTEAGGRARGVSPSRRGTESRTSSRTSSRGDNPATARNRSSSPAGRRDSRRSSQVRGSSAGSGHSSSFLGGRGGSSRSRSDDSSREQRRAPKEASDQPLRRGSLSSDFVLTEDHPCFADLRRHAILVQEILDKAKAHAHVAIVTLAAEGWVKRSADMYLPGLDLSAISIYYARKFVQSTHVKICQQEEGVNLYTLAKKRAMTRFLEKSFGKKRLYGCQQPDAGFSRNAHIRGSLSAPGGLALAGSSDGARSPAPTSFRIGAGVTICRPTMDTVNDEDGMDVELQLSPATTDESVAVAEGIVLEDVDGGSSSGIHEDERLLLAEADALFPKAPSAFLQQEHERRTSRFATMPALPWPSFSRTSVGAAGGGGPGAAGSLTGASAGQHPRQHLGASATPPLVTRSLDALPLLPPENVVNRTDQPRSFVTKFKSSLPTVGSGTVFPADLHSRSSSPSLASASSCPGTDDASRGIFSRLSQKTPGPSSDSPQHMEVDGDEEHVDQELVGAAHAADAGGSPGVSSDPYGGFLSRAVRGSPQGEDLPPGPQEDAMMKTADTTFLDPAKISLSSLLGRSAEQFFAGLEGPGGSGATAQPQAVSGGGVLAPPPSPREQATTAAATAGGDTTEAASPASGRQRLSAADFGSVRSTASSTQSKRKRDRTDFNSNEGCQDPSGPSHIPGKAVTMPDLPDLGLHPSSGSLPTLGSCSTALGSSAGSGSQPSTVAVPGRHLPAVAGQQLQQRQWLPPGSGFRRLSSGSFNSELSTATPLQPFSTDGAQERLSTASASSSRCTEDYRLSGTTSVGAVLTQDSLPEFPAFGRNSTELDGGGTMEPFPVSTVLSVGDSCAERDAAQELIWELSDSDVCPIKTVKLADEPSLPELREQLQQLKKSMLVYLAPESGDKNWDMPEVVRQAKSGGLDYFDLDGQESSPDLDDLEQLDEAMLANDWTGRRPM